jgi:hypothetical protein
MYDDMGWEVEERFGAVALDFEAKACKGRRHLA